MSNNFSGNTQTTELQYAVQTIKTAILQSQSKAAKMVSGIQLSLYYGVGLYVSAHSRKGTWAQVPLKLLVNNYGENFPVCAVSRRKA